MAKAPSLGESDSLVASYSIELANASEVREYIANVKIAVEELEALLQSAPPLRFAFSDTVKAGPKK